MEPPVKSVQFNKGLLVSTGVFTKRDRYEADCAKITLMLSDLNDLVHALVQALVENY